MEAYSAAYQALAQQLCSLNATAGAALLAAAFANGGANASAALVASTGQCPDNNRSRSEALYATAGLPQLKSPSAVMRRVQNAQRWRRLRLHVGWPALP